MSVVSIIRPHRTICAESLENNFSHFFYHSTEARRAP